MCRDGPAGGGGEQSPSFPSVYQLRHAERARGCTLRAAAREESCSIFEKHASLLPSKCHSLPLPGCRRELRSPPLSILAPGPSAHNRYFFFPTFTEI